MHPSLLISEIVVEILKLIRARNRKGDLVALALTCRAMLEPSLDALWCDIRSFDILIRLLPAKVLGNLVDWGTVDDLRELDSGTGTDSVGTFDAVGFVCPLTSADWERFRFYAKRVKALHIFDKEYLAHGYGSKGIFRALNMHHSTQALLPHIAKLTWYVRDANDFTKLMPLCGPKLQQLSLIFSLVQYPRPPSEERMLWGSMILSNLKYSCPYLAEVCIYGEDTHEFKEHVIHVSYAICALPHIRSFVSDKRVLDRAFRHLAVMPTLQKLCIYMWREELPSLLALPASHFQSLEDLELKDVSLDWAIEMFQTMRDQPLRRLKLIFSPHADERMEANSGNVLLTAPFHSFFQALHKYCDHKALRTLVLRTRGFRPGSTVIKLETFRLLFAFGGLEMLELDVAVLLKQTFDNAFIEGLSSSCRKLKFLRLNCPYAWDQAGSAITLDGLSPLAKYCPLLEVLDTDMELQQSTIPEAELRRTGDAGHAIAQNAHHLPRLQISMSQCPGEFHQVMAILQHIFPNMADITAGSERYLNDSGRPFGWTRTALAPTQPI
ncbi:hypothetical protein BV25DRAFT_1825451 [Artomyces pyxidatus]|uniref:Uncharacterized protein n=1 Tax=Artomyces pyxidatus TaxID=48021 RepID=A0ACB8T248_9AGAM|nr:hypothetical protein BV25DRAFT_1825451 [Artomyces pyxidatus]